MSSRREAIDRQRLCRGVGVAKKTGWGMAARMSRRRVLALGAGALLAAPAILRPARAQGRAVYVNSYGGVWESAWRKAFFEPFTAQTGIAIKTVPGVSFAKLKAQVQTRNFEWDLVNLGDVEYGQAVLEGLLEKVDREAAKADQLPPHMVRDYGITSYSLGTNLVYRKDKFPNGGPQSWADFWDVKKFPGSRCFYDRSFSCLAFALLADGVPADQLYPMDVERARHRSDRGQRAARNRLERGRDLLCQPAGAERRSQRQGGVAILQFRGAGQAPGGLRDVVAVRSRRSRRAGADDSGAAASDAGLARERKDSVQA